MRGTLVFENVHGRSEHGGAPEGFTTAVGEWKDEQAVSKPRVCCTNSLLTAVATSRADSRAAYRSHRQDAFVRFAFDFMPFVTEQENPVFSPASLRWATGLVALGSQGRARLELQQFLSPDSTVPPTEYDAFALALGSMGTRAKAIASSHQDNLRELANALFVDTDLKIDPRFAEDLRSIFSAHEESLPLASDQQSSASRINAFVAEKTRGLIPTLVSEDQLEDVRLVLVNTIYFRAKWKHAFDKAIAKPFATPKGSRQVSMMRLQVGDHEMRGAEVDGWKIVTLLYRSSPSSSEQQEQCRMVCILPPLKPNQPMLHQLSSNEALTLERYAMLEGALQSHSAFVVEMPKFHAQGLTLDAVPAFMGLGVEEMFRDTMDLQPMFVADPNVPPPGIAKIVHKAVVIVDEEKTEAAAVTAVLAPSAGALPSKPTEPFRFLADRPFYYLIEDLNPKTSEQTILFVGRMDEPPVWSE